MNLGSTFKLNNGLEIPVVGFGTWKMPQGPETRDIVRHAIDIGYRHIDTAAVYGNEESVGEAIAASDLNREDLFVTSKLWNTDHEYEKAKQAIDTSLEKLGLEYLDLYLIHWPNPVDYRDNWAQSNAEAWRAMEEAVQVGKIKSIGVSNFHRRHLNELLKEVKIKPAVNQIYLNPSDMQEDIVKANEENDILTEAYSPLGHGEIFTLEELHDMGKSMEKRLPNWFYVGPSNMDFYHCQRRRQNLE